MTHGVDDISGSGKWGQTAPSRQSIVVRPGEDIGSIAARLNLSTTDLLKENSHIRVKGPLRSGTEFFLPSQTSFPKTAAASGGLPSTQFERAQANIFGTLAGVSGQVDAIPRPGPDGVSATPINLPTPREGVSATPINLPNVPDGSSPPDPVPAFSTAVTAVRGSLVADPPEPDPGAKLVVGGFK